MVKNTLVIGVMFLLIVSGGFYSYYSIPQLIPDDYDCEEHPGFTPVARAMPFESTQHYVDRRQRAIQRQIERICD